MEARTYMSTDWIEVHSKDSVYMAKIFLTDDKRAYMITVCNGRKKFFQVRANLVKAGELGFFEKVMESAKELPLKQVFAILNTNIRY